MSFSTYLGAIAAICFFAFMIFLAENPMRPAPSIPLSNESSLSVEELFPALSTSTAPTEIDSTSAPLPAAVVKAPQPSYTQADVDAATARLQAALVHILCSASKNSGVHSISGSGVIIDPKGFILTNAHVAAYFLLADRGVSCKIRTGSPAQDAYLAAPVFVSPTWIRTNAAVLSEQTPLGTGEHDLAFLAITKSASRKSLPAYFPFVPLSFTATSIGDTVIIGSYGAQELDAKEIKSSLYPTIVLGSVKKIFTFTRTTIDLISLGGSIAAQEGSSGGGAVNPRGELVGTLTTSTVTGDAALRNINAITSSYVRTAFTKESGQGIDLFLKQSTANAVANFAPQIPILEDLLMQGL